MGGYYMKQDVFGTKGDFITSPEISQMFGELVGVWFVAQWKQMGSPSKFNIVELGPGRGTLMSDMLRTVTQFNDFTRAINSVNMVEASPYLRGVQSKLLTGSDEDVASVAASDAKTETVSEENREGFQIHWHDALESIERGMWFECGVLVGFVDIMDVGLPILLVAHEFFDAMPVYQFQMASDGWREVMVDTDDSPSSPHNFRFILSPGATKASVTLLQDERYLRFKEGSRIEVSPDSYSYAHRIGQRIKEDGGFALIADYGKNLIMSDTMRVSCVIVYILLLLFSEIMTQGIQSHKFVSALSKPGDSDLTADVDFSFLTKAFTDAGVTSTDIMSQGDYLRSMGIVQRLQVLMKIADAQKRKDLAQSYERLVGSSGVNGMGDIYKFMA
ncbi:UNVERIFIED_CONTAM: hypothetical protein HDU68_010766, partial [Siphonaria sp. JEL0065]